MLKLLFGLTSRFSKGNALRSRQTYSDNGDQMPTINLIKHFKLRLENKEIKQLITNKNANRRDRDFFRDSALCIIICWIYDIQLYKLFSVTIPLPIFKICIWGIYKWNNSFYGYFLRLCSSYPYILLTSAKISYNQPLHWFVLFGLRNIK